MGSSPSKASSVTITKVAEYIPDNSETGSGKSKHEPTPPVPAVETGSEQRELGAKITKEKRSPKKGASSGAISKHGDKYTVDRNDGAVESEADIITLRRCKPLPSKLPPIHYVEKNEGNLVVEDVERASVPREKSSSTSLPDAPLYEEAGGLVPASSSTSLPEVDQRPRKIKPIKIDPIDPTSVGKLGVSGRDLLLQLQSQGIVSVHGTHHVDSSTIIGQLTHLGLIKESTSGGAEGTVYDESERRKMPARLARINHSEVHRGAFPNPEEKRRRLRNRPHQGGCGIQMNEDVVNNAIQRACARERKGVKNVVPTETENDQKTLKKKISEVELL